MRRPKRSSGVCPPAHLPLPDRLTQLEPAHVCKQDESARRPVGTCIRLKHPAPKEAAVPHEVGGGQAAACQHARHVGQRAQLHSRQGRGAEQNARQHPRQRQRHRQYTNKTPSARPHQQSRLQTGLPLSQLMAVAGSETKPTLSSTTTCPCGVVSSGRSTRCFWNQSKLAGGRCSITSAATDCRHA